MAVIAAMEIASIAGRKERGRAETAVTFGARGDVRGEYGKGCGRAAVEGGGFEDIVCLKKRTSRCALLLA